MEKDNELEIPASEPTKVKLTVGTIKTDRDTIAKIWCKIYDARWEFINLLEDHGYSYEQYHECDEYKSFCKLMDTFM